MSNQAARSLKKLCDMVGTKTQEKIWAFDGYSESFILEFNLPGFMQIQCKPKLTHTSFLLENLSLSSFLPLPPLYIHNCVDVNISLERL